MKFIPLALDGIFRIEPEPFEDERGFFARIYCPEEFRAAEIDFAPAQINLSRNKKARTLRGMHYQDPPNAEAKLIRATSGALFDVVIDLRPRSQTYKQWLGVELDAERATALFVPEGFAHGFLTYIEQTDVVYMVGRPYTPGYAKGVRWNDPAFGIDWPETPVVISEADRNWPDFG